MNTIELTQNVDFLDIALEEIEAQNYDSASEFITDVRDSLRHNGRHTTAQKLLDADNELQKENYDEGRELVEDVYEELESELV